MLRFAFTSVRWLVAYNTEWLREDAVCWHHHSLLNHNDIAYDKIFRTNFILAAISEHKYWSSVTFVLELLELLFLWVVVDRSHKGDDNDSNSNGHSLHESAPSVFNNANDWAHNTGSHQDLKNGVFKRLEEKLAEGVTLSFQDFVWAVSIHVREKTYFSTRSSMSAAVPSIPLYELLS